MCNAWDWEASQFPSYGGVSTFKEVGIKKKSRTFKEVGGNKKTRVRSRSPNPGLEDESVPKRGIAWAGKVPSPKLRGGLDGYYKGERVKCGYSGV